MTMMKMSDEEKKSLRNHANRNIAYLLDQLAISYTDRGDGLIQSCCGCKQHGGDRDNPTAFSWRPDLGKWVCWTHHCEEARGNDIFGLVSSVLGSNFKETTNDSSAKFEYYVFADKNGFWQFEFPEKYSTKVSYLKSKSSGTTKLLNGIAGRHRFLAG